jgi:hypothetical protein
MLPPEQARGGELGDRADVCWEACGNTPFPDEPVTYPQLEKRAPLLRRRRRLAPHH